MALMAAVCRELVLPGEGRPLSCIKGVSELFDRVVLTRQTKDALLIQAVLFDELHTLLHQNRHHVRPKPLLVCHRLLEAFPKHCREAGRSSKFSKSTSAKVNKTVGN